MAIKLPPFQKSVPLVEGDKPSFAFHVWWNQVVKTLETAVGQVQESVIAIEAALAAAQVAQAAAVAAQASAVAAQEAADGIIDGTIRIEDGEGGVRQYWNIP